MERPIVTDGRGRLQFIPPPNPEVDSHDADAGFYLIPHLI